jgi:signal transduction histidine kinase
MLNETKLDNTQRDQLQIISNSGNLLLHIINNILDLAKIEADKVELEHCPINIRPIIEQVAHTATILIKGKIKSEFILYHMI